MNEIKLETDWKHWLFGVNWGNNLIGTNVRIIAFHFGPWCLMFIKTTPTKDT